MKGQMDDSIAGAWCVHLNGERISPDSTFKTEDEAICALMLSGLTSAHGFNFAVLPLDTDSTP